MTNTSHKLTNADRAELCHRVDLLALLQADGVDVCRNGAAYLCKLRDEKTASCRVYPPGVGQKGAAGWTLHDYGGDGWGGDALAYLVDKRGLSFVEAVGELCRLTGYTPQNWTMDRPGCPRIERTAPSHTLTPRADLRPPTLDHEAQLKAAVTFVLALESICPEAAAKGEAYLAARGCLPAPGTVGAWELPADACKPLCAALASGSDAELLTRAGLLKPAEGGKPMRLPWWDRVCLLGCYDADGSLAYFVGRRLDWTAGDTTGKYINQSCAGGAVRLPYNLPALYHAAGLLKWHIKPAPDKAGDVLLVEGALDALGAAVLGWPAVALLNRPQAHDYKDQDGAAARMLKAHLPALRDVGRVRVVPDADQGTKGAEGEALAARLVGWLHYNGVPADVATLADLCPDAPAECKDLADVAKLKGCPS